MISLIHSNTCLIRSNFLIGLDKQTFLFRQNFLKFFVRQNSPTPSLFVLIHRRLPYLSEFTDTFLICPNSPTPYLSEFLTPSRLFVRTHRHHPYLTEYTDTFLIHPNTQNIIFRLSSLNSLSFLFPFRPNGLLLSIQQKLLNFIVQLY